MCEDMRVVCVLKLEQPCVTFNGLFCGSSFGFEVPCSVFRRVFGSGGVWHVFPS